jgi:hypothetical protein
MSLEEGAEVGVSGEVSITGPVTIGGPITLSSGSTVETIMVTEVVELLYDYLDYGDLLSWIVDEYKTVHIYYIYSTSTYPDAYSLSMDFSIPDPNSH